MTGVVEEVAEEIVAEAHRGGESRLAALARIGGFPLFALLAVYLKTVRHS